MLADCHTHLTGDVLQAAVQAARRDQLLLLPNGGSPAACRELLQAKAGCGLLLPTFGLHPWHADPQALEDMLPYLPLGAAVGEIGMDSVWCDVPLETQRAVFARQLTVAADLGKPVVLHTKGCEREIAELITGHPSRCLVHWYSCLSHLDLYINMGCWFTIGPATQDPAVRQVAMRAPLDRLLLETDGPEAVLWATGAPLDVARLAAHLRGRLHWLARLRQVPPHLLEAQLYDNLCAFIGTSPAA